MWSWKTSFAVENWAAAGVGADRLIRVATDMTKAPLERAGPFTYLRGYQRNMDLSEPQSHDEVGTGSQGRQLDTPVAKTVVAVDWDAMTK